MPWAFPIPYSGYPFRDPRFLPGYPDADWTAIQFLDEIKARFPSEWVLIGEPQTDEALELLAGEVLFHSTDRDEVDHKLMELRPHRFAVRYLGPSLRTWLSSSE
jgi:hypothetical protein